MKAGLTTGKDGLCSFARVAIFGTGLLAFALTSDPAHAGLKLELVDHSLTADQIQASHAVLDGARDALPPALVQQLNHRIPVSWSASLPDEIIGRATPSGQLQLNSRFLNAWLTGSDTALPPGRSHGNLQRELTATVVHEVAHLYDRGMFLSDEQNQLLRRCEAQHNSLGMIGLPRECRGQIGRRFTLSDDPRLLDLAGWPEQVGTRGERETENRQLARSPDAYELSSPREFVAVNLEYFLTDPEYRCRRPALQEYFAEHFGWTPAFEVNCPNELPFMNAGLNAGLHSTSAALSALDPERIYQVHYLLAEPDDNWASRWGHSMLRLVICAPGRAMGPECLLDLEHHLVLSFRAFVNDVQLSSWDGLIGNYPSRLFLLPLNQVVDEYTKQELRSLSSVPLRLSRTEQIALAQRAVEMHWSYDGTYYFVSNNCAVETLKLLRSGTHHPELRDLDSITPTGLLRSLDFRHLTDTSVLQDRSEAIRQGLYFDSYRARYQRMFSVARSHLPIPLTEVEDWLDAPPKTREEWFEQTDQRTAAALMLLEQAALHRLALRIQHDIKKRYVSNRDLADDELGEAASLMRQAMGVSGFLSRPSDLLPEGYGLPQPGERQALQTSSSARQQELLDLLTSLDQRVERLLTADQAATLEATKLNVSALGDRLRHLHTESGGLVLP